MAKSRSKPVEALDMLKQDHDKVEKAFREFEQLAQEDAEACHALVMSACEELKIHTTLEEEIFYPAVHDAIDDEEIMSEAAVEHETARMLIEQLENMEEDDPNYHATFKVLGEYVRHHIREEEGRMFPAARKSDLDFDALGARMRERREELMGETEKGPDAVSASAARSPQPGGGNPEPELTRRR
jgi:hemerythrin-like domain-containing protein